jgi:hypothetical protein
MDCNSNEDIFRSGLLATRESQNIHKSSESLKTEGLDACRYYDVPTAENPFHSGVPFMNTNSQFYGVTVRNKVKSAPDKRLISYLRLHASTCTLQTQVRDSFSYFTYTKHRVR